MNKILPAALLLSFVLTASGCKVWRGVFHKKEKKAAVVVNSTATSTTVKETPQGTYSGADTAKTNTQLSALMPLWQKNFSWDNFDGKARVHYEGKGEAQDFTATIRMERGKKVWVSIIALGLVEAVRALITPDSVIVLDRIHHTYRALGANEAGKVMPAGVDFSALQSLIIGEVLHRTQSPQSVETLTDGGIQFTLNNGGLYQNAVFNAVEKTLRSQSFLYAQSNSSADMRYDDYGNSGGRIFSKHRTMQLHDKGADYTIDMDFKSAEFDKQLEMPFSIPARYDKK